MKTTHNDLTVCWLTPDFHAKTCGYWYVVQSHCMAHTAFATLEHLQLWACERGLTLPTLAKQGDWGKIGGEYRTESHLRDADEFESIPGERSRTLSNGDYVVAIIATDSDGIRTVHTLNPNVKGRRVYDYRESRTLIG